MTILISRRFTALLAAAFLICVVLGFTKEGNAQPPPPPCDTCTCSNCLQPQLDAHPNPCGGCAGCYTWAILNNCDSCIDSIVISTKFSNPFAGCCVAVDSASHGTWNWTQYSPCCIVLYATSGCLNKGRFLLVTTCGLTHGELLVMGWIPGNRGFLCDTTGGQNYEFTVPGL
jgi:hypothetical protein